MDTVHETEAVIKKQAELMPGKQMMSLELTKKRPRRDPQPHHSSGCGARVESRLGDLGSI